MEIFVVAMAIFQVISFVVLARRVLKELEKAKTANGLTGRETRLVGLYGHLEELMDVFEVYVDEVRQEIEKERSALLEMSRQAAALYARTQGMGDPRAQASEDGKQGAKTPEINEASKVSDPEISVSRALKTAARGSKLSDKDRETLKRFSTKSQCVHFLMGRGFSLEEVAREMGIGTGEVRLIIELEK